MARPEKVAAVTEVRRRLEASPATVLTEYRGLSVGDLQELRARLRANGADYKVVKNTLTRLAARDAGLDVPDDLLVGPTAITFCGEDPVAAAKVLRSFSREHPELIVKGSILEGSVLSAEETLKLADLASREELLARIAGMLGALVAMPARLARANLDKLARLLGAYHDKRREAGDTADEPEAGAGAADATAGEGAESAEAASGESAEAGSDESAGAAE